MQIQIINSLVNQFMSMTYFFKFIDVLSKEVGNKSSR